MELPPKTQEFLQKLDEEDIEKIQRALKVYETVETLGWAVKWLAITSLAFFVFLTQLKDHITKLFH